MRSRSRVVFVDLLRFLAALQMMQGHTIAALLAPEYRHGPWYVLWSTTRGLTSVAFLFAAGLSFYLATERRHELQGMLPSDGAGATAASGVRRRSWRAVRLIALGYLLHLPIAAFTASDAATRADALRAFVAVDVLQCIGVSMLLLEALRAGVASAAARTWACAGFAAACLAAAPFAATLPASGALRPLLAYVTPEAGSLFPLTPWAAHVALGFVCGALVRAPLRWSISARVAGLTVACFAAYASCALLQAPGVITDHVSRLVGVCLGAFLLSLLGERLEQAPRAVAALARNTLALYVFHILLVYGYAVGLATWIGPRLGPAGAVAAALVVIAVSAAVALGYDRLAQARRTG